LHGAATIAKDTAEIVLLTPDLMHLPYLIGMAGRLERRMNVSETMNTASGVACVSGVLVFGMGIGPAIALYTGGLLLNTSGALLPLLERTGPDRSNPGK
jgi:Cu2+-exporting ATPase